MRKHVSRYTILGTVTKRARQVGIDADRLNERGIAVQSLRKTAITNALETGAPIGKLHQLAGRADSRTTLLYYRPSAQDRVNAARHIQFR